MNTDAACATDLEIVEGHGFGPGQGRFVAGESDV